MGDSDDDVDYKRRDKFHTERRGYDRSIDRGVSPRHDHNEWRESGRGGGGGQGWSRDRRGGYNDGGYRRDRYPSPPGRRHEMSPPHKRMRDDRYDGGGYGHSRGGPPNDYYGRTSSLRSLVSASGPPAMPPRPALNDRDSDQYQPPMMSFKAFLTTQDDGISDEDAIKKYGEYKLEFKRQQLNEFFVTHKEEEWFKLKYHPEDSVKRREELRSMLLKRIDVFVDFFGKGKFDGVSIDGDQSEQLIKVLDSVVIMLEGGSEADLQVLEQSEGEKKDEKAVESSTTPDTEKNSIKTESGEPDEVDPDGKGRKRNFDEAISSSSSSSEDEGENGNPPKAKSEKENGSSSPKANGGSSADLKDKEHLAENEARALHKTTSIFLRNLPPSVTKQEVEAMCKRYSGFLRAAISDPQPERRWMRRGWVTFERNSKIKDICFSFNNARLRDCELGPIVNRDLSRRIRTVTGLTVDKKVVRNDIKLAAKIISNLDKRWELWKSDGSDAKEASADDMMNMISPNPVLSNITDYLIEEASAEEEELLGKNNDLEDGEEGEDGSAIVRDEELIKVLDRLLFYLRIVHSVDYYNHSEYPNEDEMPNRCGILHARASMQAGGKVAPFEIDEYCTTFEKKMGSFLQPRSLLSDDEANKLGMKNEEDEVEKFIQANTQELGKDKWLCPLSGKKFKGPDFVRKHIFYKHGEKIEEVKKEVQYYNSYLKDPRRPQLPENPANKAQPTGAMGRSVSQREVGGGFRGHGGGYPPDRYHYSGYPREATSYPVFEEERGRSFEGRYERGGYRGRGRYDNYGGRGGGGGGRFGGSGENFNMGGRPIITYRDLDAPGNDDF